MFALGVVYLGVFLVVNHQNIDTLKGLETGCVVIRLRQEKTINSVIN